MSIVEISIRILLNPDFVPLRDNVAPLPNVFSAAYEDKTAEEIKIPTYMGVTS